MLYNVNLQIFNEPIYGMHNSTQAYIRKKLGCDKRSEMLKYNGTCMDYYRKREIKQPPSITNKAFNSRSFLPILILPLISILLPYLHLPPESKSLSQISRINYNSEDSRANSALPLNSLQGPKPTLARVPPNR